MKRILTASAVIALAALTAAPALAAAASTSTTTKPATTTSMAPKMAATAKPAMASAKPTAVTFKTIDANHDGRISYDELKKYWPTLSKADFAKYDTSKDGFYNHAELAAFAKAMQPAKTTTGMGSMMSSKPTTAAKPATK